MFVLIDKYTKVTLKMNKLVIYGFRRLIYNREYLIQKI